MLPSLLKKKDKKGFVDRKTLLQNKSKSKTATKNSKSPKSLSQRERDLIRAKKQKIWLFISAIVASVLAVLITILGVGWLNYTNKIKENIIPIEASAKCKDFSHSEVNSFLSIDIDKAENIKDIRLNLFSNERYYSYGIKDYVFLIDNGGTEGKIEEYIRVNNLFLDKKTLFKYLASLISRQLFIKVDYIIITKGEIKLDDYNKIRNSYIQTLFDPSALKTDSFQIYTDICQGTFDSAIDSFFLNESRINRRDFNSSKIKDLFELTNIKKEQLRVHINNKTGVTGWGKYYEEYLESYGLNVVKLDNSSSVTNKTTVSVDNESIKSSNTLRMVRYLVNNEVADIDVNTQTNIFSNVYIELGEDTLK